MIALAPREFHLFQAAGRDFLYLVPSAAIFALDESTSAVLRLVTEQKRPEAAVIAALAGRFDPATVGDAIARPVGGSRDRVRARTRGPLPAGAAVDAGRGLPADGGHPAHHDGA